LIGVYSGLRSTTKKQEDTKKQRNIFEKKNETGKNIAMKHLHDIPPIKHHGTYVYNTVYIYITLPTCSQTWRCVEIPTPQMELWGHSPFRSPFFLVKYPENHHKPP